MLEEQSRMNKWGNFQEMKCQCFYNYLWAIKKKWNVFVLKNASLAKHQDVATQRKQPETKPQQSCFHPRMSRNWRIRPEIWPGTVERKGDQGRGEIFLFLDLVLTINLNLKMLLLSEESEMDLFNKYLLTSYYVPRTIVDSLCIATKETKNPVLMEHIFSGWGIAQECIHTLSCCSELTLDTHVSCLASTKHTLWDLWFYVTIKASLPLLMRPCSVLQ